MSSKMHTLSEIVLLMISIWR